MWAVSSKVPRRVPSGWIDELLGAFEKKYKIRPGQEISIVVVGSAESRKLNFRYRGKDKATNVLSFPDTGRPSVGEVVLCLPVIKQEAKTSDRGLKEYFQYILAHGLLHIIGFDHISERDAVKMEAAEKKLLEAL